MAAAGAAWAEGPGSGCALGWMDCCAGSAEAARRLRRGGATSPAAVAEAGEEPCWAFWMASTNAPLRRLEAPLMPREDARCFRSGSSIFSMPPLRVVEADV